MKRFYTTFALAAAVAISASAANFSARKVARTDLKAVSTQEMQLIESDAVVAVRKAPVAKAKPTKVEDIYGYFTLTRTLRTSPQLPTTTDATIEPGGNADNPNEVLISGLEAANGYLPVVGIFDPEAGTLSIASGQTVRPQYVEDDFDFGAVLLRHIEGFDSIADGVEGRFFRRVTTPVVATFDDNGNLLFNQDDGFIEDLENTPDGNQYYFGGYLGLVSEKLLPPSNEGWEDYGKATFTDGWLSPMVQYFCFSNSQTEMPVIAEAVPAYDVALQRNKENPNIYRLVDPYGDAFNEAASTANKLPEPAIFNFSYVSGAIEFDIENPKCVLVSPNVYSGADEAVTGLGLMYMSNQAGDFVYGSIADGDTKEEALEVFIEVFGSEAGFKFSTYDSASRLVTINDAIFISQIAKDMLFTTWTDVMGFFKTRYPADFASFPSTIDMTSYIVLPDASGINNVITDKTNTTLEYFNLQGVRVNNPSNGIYIRRQGNDVQKVYVR